MMLIGCRFYLQNIKSFNVNLCLSQYTLELSMRVIV
jgi:hypothetical protein